MALKRTLSVWQVIGLSVALLAPSMAANINPQLMVVPDRRRWSPRPWPALGAARAGHGSSSGEKLADVR